MRRKKTNVVGVGGVKKMQANAFPGSFSLVKISEPRWKGGNTIAVSVLRLYDNNFRMISSNYFLGGNKYIHSIFVSPTAYTHSSKFIKRRSESLDYYKRKQ